MKFVEKGTISKYVIPDEIKVVDSIPKPVWAKWIKR